jgi:predicted ATPase/DNA-binding SARP family transcriptional activator
VRIAMLGPLEVHADGRPVEVGGARLRALLILLALDAGRVVNTHRLVDGLWGDDPPAGAPNALQTLVSRLRRALPGAVVESHPTGYRLAVDPEAVDVLRFERLVTAGRRALAADPAAAVAAFDEAAALWRGPALADVAGADFARTASARLSELRLTATEDRVEGALRLGGGADLVAELEELVAAHPLRERLVDLLMRALVAANRRAEALAAYERLRAVLADRLGTDPSPALAAAHLAVLRAPAAPPGADPATTLRTNLRAGLTSFVGRDEDVVRVGKLVGEYRLTTLTGPGGAGKTRLAVECARTLLDDLTDGVWLVALAPVTDPAEVPRAVFDALGLRERALLAGRARERASEAETVDPTDRLVSLLASRELLLVFDNCEHLIGAAAALADRVLGDCPRVRVLATSREALGITGEAQWPVEPLALPPSDVDSSAAVRYPAVRLFADRATAVRPGFAVDPSTVDAVVRVCRALDGIPLAIELAAARLSALTPDQVAARLDDRFRLLARGNRTALPRHQTLRAVVDWSWDLLDAVERALLRRLSAFTGGATVEAAERVCGFDPLRPGDVLDVATALVDKSLLVPFGDERFGMLETIRMYGAEQLDASGERERVRRAHAAYFLDLATAAEPHLRDRDQLRWLARLDADHDNLHVAVRGAITAGEADTALRLVGMLGWYWWLRGHRIEATDLMVDAFDLPDATADDVPAEVRALAYAVGAVNGLSSRDGHQQLRWFRQAAALGAGRAGAHPLLRLLDPMATLIEDWGGTDSMRELAGCFDDPDLWVRSLARFMHAHAQINVGLAEDAAEANFRVALDGFRTLGERWGTAASLTAVADLTSRRGDHAAAEALLGEALTQVAELGAVEEVPQIRSRLAHELWLAGERARARTVLAQALRDAERFGEPEVLARVEYQSGEFARIEGDLAQARARLTHAGELIAGLNIAPQFFALISSSLGYLDVAAGDLGSARAHHLRAIEQAMAPVDAPVVAQLLVGLADLALAEGDPAHAARLLGASESVRGGVDHALLDAPRVTALVRAALGDGAFDDAYERGRTTTLDGVRALVGFTPGA